VQLLCDIQARLAFARPPQNLPLALGQRIGTAVPRLRRQVGIHHPQPAMHPPQRAAAEIADVEMISRTALTEVREAIRGYRAEGLAAEIKRAHSTLDAAGVTLVCEDKPPELTPAVESVVSLIVREAVTNIVRHAQASRCSMSFSAQNGHTSLVVEDDGRGGVRAEGNGLRGMRERIEALGGQFAVDGSRGTRLTILLPTDVHAPLDEAEMTS